MKDIGMFVGVKHYPWPADFAEEARAQGVSKDISKSNPLGWYSSARRCTGYGRWNETNGPVHGIVARTRWI